MTTFPHNSSQASAKAATYKQINDAINTLAMETDVKAVLPGEENPDTPVGRIERLLNIYEALKPLLATIATLVLLPNSWRAAISLFLAALEAVADGLPSFKAGKDL